MNLLDIIRAQQGQTQNTQQPDLGSLVRAPAQAQSQAPSAQPFQSSTLSWRDQLSNALDMQNSSGDAWGAIGKDGILDYMGASLMNKYGTNKLSDFRYLADPNTPGGYQLDWVGRKPVTGFLGGVKDASRSRGIVSGVGAGDSSDGSAMTSGNPSEALNFGATWEGKGGTTFGFKRDPQTGLPRLVTNATQSNDTGDIIAGLGVLAGGVMAGGGLGALGTTTGVGASAAGGTAATMGAAGSAGVLPSSYFAGAGAGLGAGAGAAAGAGAGSLYNSIVDPMVNTAASNAGAATGAFGGAGTTAGMDALNAYYANAAAGLGGAGALSGAGGTTDLGGGLTMSPDGGISGAMSSSQSGLGSMSNAGIESMINGGSAATAGGGTMLDKLGEYAKQQLSPQSLMRTAAGQLLGGGGGGGNDLAGIIGGMTDAKRQGDASRKMLEWLNGNQAKMEELYKPGSAEYDQLWQAMSRRDAAAGRNSQYGPRTAQFAAEIAKNRADNIRGFTTGTSRAYSDALNQDAAKYAGLSAAVQRAMGSGRGLDLERIANMLGFGPSGQVGGQLSNEDFYRIVSGQGGMPMDYGMGQGSPTEEDVWDWISGGDLGQFF